MAHPKFDHDGGHMLEIIDHLNILIGEDGIDELISSFNVTEPVHDAAYYSDVYVPLSFKTSNPFTTQPSLGENLDRMESLIEMSDSMAYNRVTSRSIWFFNDVHETFNEQFEKYGDSFTGFRPRSFIGQIIIKADAIRKSEVEYDASRYARELLKIREISSYVAMMLATYYSESVPVKRNEWICVLDEVYTRADAIRFVKECEYGSAWTRMEPPQIFDMMYVKMLRIKNSVGYGSEITEKVYLDLIDIINYSLYATVLLEHQIRTSDVEMGDVGEKVFESV